MQGVGEIIDEDGGVVTTLDDTDDNREILQYGFVKPERGPRESYLDYSKRISLAFEKHARPFIERERAEAKRYREAMARPPVESWRLRQMLTVQEYEQDPVMVFLPGTPVMRLNRDHLVKRFGGLHYVSILEPEPDSAYLLARKPEGSEYLPSYPAEVDDLDASMLEPMPFAGLPLEWRARLAYGRQFHSLMHRKEPLTLGCPCERKGCKELACTEALTNHWGSVGAEYVCKAHALRPDVGRMMAD